MSAAWQPVDGGRALRIGYVSPDGAGVQVVQTNAPVDSFLPVELTAKARPEGNVDVAGTAWQAYTARPGERALVLLEPDAGRCTCSAPRPRTSCASSAAALK